MTDKFVNYYEELGISFRASKADIQRAIQKHAQNQTLDLDTLTWCKEHLLNAPKRTEYNLKLLKKYPHLMDEEIEEDIEQPERQQGIIPNWIRYSYGTLIFILILIAGNYREIQFYLYLLILLILISLIIFSKKNIVDDAFSYQDVAIVYSITTGKVIGTILALGLLFALMSGDIRLFAKQSEHSEGSASYACKEAVKAVMKAPTQTTVSFDKFTVNGSTYTFFGKVDAPNSFGVMLRSNVSCTATHQSGSNYSTSVSVQN